MKKDAVFRHIIFIIIIALAFGLTLRARAVGARTQTVRLYFVDAEMMRLMPVETTIPAMNTQKSAQRVLDELIAGRDDNPKIRRIIPNERRCMTVRVKGETAWVDLKRTFVEGHPEGRDMEILTVYSVVNTLTALDGIKTVRFTVCGKQQRSFKGFLDMRETFVPDYFV